MSERISGRSMPLAIMGVVTLVFLMLPILIVAPMSFSSARALTFPPPGFSVR
ncbi:MAG TPA: hypothetical protein VJR58_14875 [Vineibacter sp.]|nr:hypothetical protein [Vineibacter sp.]